MGRTTNPDTRGAAVRRGRPGSLGRITAIAAAAGVLAAGPPVPDPPPQADEARPAGTTCAPPALAALKPPPTPQLSPPEAAYDPLRGWDPDIDLGVGHLDSMSDSSWDWALRIRLPLFPVAGDTPSHWIVDGWLVPYTGDDAPRPFGVAGLTEVAYEVPSFIVLENREDGWLRFRYGPAATELAWTHRCFFDQPSGQLRIERWEARFTSGEISPLYFRARVPHALRAEPDPQSQRLRWVPAREGDYVLDPIEIRGDWMRVEVREPSDYCVEPERVEKTVGWVQWRDEERGPRVWYHTRGC